jgi:hypothetical protein
MADLSCALGSQVAKATQSKSSFVTRHRQHSTANAGIASQASSNVDGSAIGVRRKAWRSPPVMPTPTICPWSLMSLAQLMPRLARDTDDPARASFSFSSPGQRSYENEKRRCGSGRFCGSPPPLLNCPMEPVCPVKHPCTHLELPVIKAFLYAILFIVVGLVVFALIAPLIFQAEHVRRAAASAFPVIVVVCGAMGFWHGLRRSRKS